MHPCTSKTAFCQKSSTFHIIRICFRNVLMSTALLIAPCKFYAMDAQATTPPECLLLTAKAAGLLTLGTVESVLGVLTGIGGGILTHMTADHDKLLYAIGITGSFATVVFSLYHGIPTLYEGGSLLGQALTVDCR